MAQDGTAAEQIGLGPGDTLAHATVVESAGNAILLIGPSASGKSDLALRLIAWPATGLGLAPFRLVADDQVLLTATAGTLSARPPETIAGRIEVRGLGILTLPYATSAAVRLVIALAPGTRIERMPDPTTRALAGVSLPEIRLDAFEPSAPIRAALALRQVITGAD